MDRITFDFENDLFIAENDEGKLEQKIPGLSRSRQRILADAGILIMDASGMGDLLRQLQDGTLDQEEFCEELMEKILDHVKSQYHDSLN
ncbi:MAG: hypothetical protein Q4D59_00165 [Erysipelotrichaceae bacterium]|jgi:hypothetical protein|nr:hypothetical protein [Erysipelotrichaceae bacterium]MDO5108320.1 hypothetical protein [Erysipelotrichaceae bacterium]